MEGFLLTVITLLFGFFITGLVLTFNAKEAAEKNEDKLRKVETEEFNKNGR